MNFTGKKVAILGLGVEGQDLCQFLLQKGAKITVFDQKNAQELENYKTFSQKGVSFVTGDNYLKNGLCD